MNFTTQYTYEILNFQLGANYCTLLYLDYIRSNNLITITRPGANSIQFWTVSFTAKTDVGLSMHIRYAFYDSLARFSL